MFREYYMKAAREIRRLEASCKNFLDEYLNFDIIEVNMIFLNNCYFPLEI